MRVSYGISLNEEQKKELSQLFNVSDVEQAESITIDGSILNNYLKDGSNETTNVYSSAKVEFKNHGYGVQVNILTPENIKSVSSSMYQNAAIAAGATNADIQIASIVPVTGEGALAGVYEIFSQSGMSLGSQDIQNAENQIKIEQLLAEESNLISDQISMLITEINLGIVEALESKDELVEDDIKEIIQKTLSSNNTDLTEKAINLIMEHGENFSQSDVAKNPETKLALEETLNNYKELESIFSKSFDIGYGQIKINEVKILSENHFDNVVDKPVIGIWYSVSLNTDTAPKSAFNAWFDSVKVLQDNNPNTINELIGGNVPDYDLVINELNNQIKPGGTGQLAMAFQTDDFETQLDLYFYRDKYNDKDYLDKITIPLDTIEIVSE
ncbi:DUF1002 domain-containing protein [Aerococcaceae bacterium WGS1372]